MNKRLKILFQYSNLNKQRTIQQLKQSQKYGNQDVEYADPRIIPLHYKEGEYKKDPNVIRIKIFERFYRWWIRTGNDFRNAVIPIFGCFFFTITIYYLSVFLYEREEKQKLKAQIPEYLSDRKKFEEFKKRKKLLEEQKKDQ